MRYKHKRRKKKTVKQYSKKVLKVMIALWFIVAFFGMAVTVYQLIKSPESVSMDGLYGYVGIPMSGGIISYLIKSAIENKEKISNNPTFENETEEI